jgi:DNA-binding helix-hairpin-helix protein with protein kinase domain
MRTMGLLALASTSLLLIGLVKPAFALIMLPVCVCIVGVWLAAYVNSPHYIERRERRAVFHERERDLALAERAVHTAIASLSSQYETRCWEASKQKDRFAELQSQETNEVNQLQTHARARQLEEYLDQFFIKDAKLKDIGNARIAALESFGVETAADATDAKIGAVPGFGPKLTARLTSWRASLEARFRFDPVKGVPQADLFRIRNKYLQMRYLCQRQLERNDA